MYSGGIKDEAYTTFEGLTGTGGAFQGFPTIFHDYSNLAYSGTTCAIGAFGS
jgi:hypothetical protein